ncbi:20538_t:CDS:2 [Gigaspora margarita]|uniref:20538_t:CDS:1 n=1 Tax=Gigaspora margarita TaxID=4874 RepID=A0ABN7VYJ3_GIGMA|nr:20538_t:CDS:2 [Gigaspora margarita]
MSSETISVEKKRKWNDDPNNDDQKDPTRQPIRLPSKPYWVDKVAEEERNDNWDNWPVSDQKLDNLDNSSVISKSDSDGFDCRSRSLYSSKSVLESTRSRHKTNFSPYNKTYTPSSPRHLPVISTTPSVSPPPSSAITDIKNNLDNGCKSAANTLTKFIQAIGSLLIEATKNFLGAPIVIQYFADGTDPIFYQGATSFDAKRIGYSQSGFYMLREFHKEVEEYLKKEFPTSQIESNGNDKKWSVSISNFIDAKQVRRHLGLKETSLKETNN